MVHDREELIFLLNGRVGDQIHESVDLRRVKRLENGTAVKESIECQMETGFTIAEDGSRFDRSSNKRDGRVAAAREWTHSSRQRLSQPDGSDAHQEWWDGRHDGMN